ncbi:MAG: hypothetical protein ACI396_05920 [Acutalibacteraceae bacterium]
MAEYIEREAALKRIKELQKTNPNTVGKKQFADGYFCGLDESEIILNQISAADVAEVVRCRDCRFWNKMSDSAQGRCILSENYPTGTYFCANGKKRMDGDTE